MCTIVQIVLVRTCTACHDDRKMNDRADGWAAVAAAIRARRTRLGLTQQEVADLAGVSTRFVHTVEAAKPSLRLDRLLDVLEVLGLGLQLTTSVGFTPSSDVGHDGHRS